MRTVPVCLLLLAFAGLFALPGCAARRSCRERGVGGESLSYRGATFPRFHSVPTRPAFAPRGLDGLCLRSAPAPFPPERRDGPPDPETPPLPTAEPRRLDGSTTAADASPRRLDSQSWIFHPAAPPRLEPQERSAPDRRAERVPLSR